MKKLIYTLAACIFISAFPGGGQSLPDSVLGVYEARAGGRNTEVVLTELTMERFMEEVPDFFWSETPPRTIFSNKHASYEVVRDLDSALVMLEGKARLGIKRYNWMGEDERYIYSITAANGMKIVFRQIYPLCGYYPELDLITFGWNIGDDKYPTNIYTGEIEDLPWLKIESDYRRFRIVMDWVDGKQTAVIQYRESHLGEFETLIGLEEIFYDLPSEVYWKGDALYVYRGGTQKVNYYFKIVFPGL